MCTTLVSSSRQDGLFTPVQNVVVGWGTAFVIILSDMCFHYDNFGGEYHCWLRLDSNLMYGIYIPMIMLVVMTFAVVEAAGSSDYTVCFLLTIWNLS